MKKLLFMLLNALLFCAAQAQNVEEFHVVHYDLNLDLTDFTHHTISGMATLTIVPSATTISHIALDIQGPVVDSLWVNHQIVQFTQSNNQVVINHTLAVGDTALVEVRYHGVPAQDTYWGGFYWSGEYCYNLGVAFDDQPHNFGRCWYPCQDLFTDKSTYAMHIRTQAGKMAVCGGELTDSLMLPDSSCVWTWQLEQPIPTYLASVAVGPYRLYADTFQGMERVIPIHIYAQPTTIQNVSGSFVHLKSILRLFEQYFGPYPWSRVGYVAVNFTSGAMEHATNIAYPNVAINGNTSYEILFAHELFHHWFGDYITCNRAEEMWINEGFATYSEAMVSGLVSASETGYQDYIRDVHRTTLKDIVKDDGDHFALDNVPQTVTYGTHSYQKGSLIIHTLRNYMGDSLFFAAIRSMLEQYAWQNISSEQLFSYLSQFSGMNLMDFYEGWVHQPGFPHFSVDSVVSLGGDSYRVHLRQKRSEGVPFVNSNKVDLTFISEQRELFTVQQVMFSGETASVEVSLPFVPMFAMVDYTEKLADAVIDYNNNIVSGETVSCGDAFFTVHLDDFSDTVWVRVERNFVAPDHGTTLPVGIDRISDNSYWNVGMAFDQSVNMVPTGYMQFRYQSGATSSPDHDLMSGYGKENLKLLYRASTGDNWQILPVTVTGSVNSGTLKSNVMLPGQYCLAVGDVTASTEMVSDNVTMMLRPNPARNELSVWLDGVKGRVQAEVLDLSGRQIMLVKMKNGSNVVNLETLRAGNYLIKIKDAAGSIAVRRFIKQ